jgi:glycerate dehydrogenase
MGTERIVFLDRASLIAEVRRPALPHAWQEYAASTAEDVVQKLQGASIAITNKVPLRREVLMQLPGLRMIAVAATGTEHIDLDCCRERGISVANIRNYAVHAVPEHVFMLVLALRRNLLAYREDLRQGLWQQSSQFCLFTHPLRDLYGSTLGIIGYGALGQAVARLGEAFGMRCFAAGHKGVSTLRPGFTAFEQVLQESDVVTLHAPLNAQTRNLIAAPELALMQPHALLINTARGGLVDEQALADALRRGAIGGAGFDVLSAEPPRQGNVLLELELPNFILTPHVAWASREDMQALADQLIDNIDGFVRGELRNRVV